MNRQEIFNKVATHLLKQGRKAIDEFVEISISCVYQASNGDRCAIGTLIPDGHEALKYPGEVSMLLTAYPELKNLWGLESKSDLRFLTDLQEIHDKVKPEEWTSALEFFAESLNLEMVNI